MTLIFSAGRVSILRIYMEKGFNVKYSANSIYYDSPVEENPLFHAVLRNEKEMVKLLIKHKVDVSVKIGGYTALDVARCLDLQGILRVLQLEHKRKKLSAHPKENKSNEESPYQTLLTLSLPNEILLPAISKFVSNGHDINAYDNCGFAPLHNSIFKDNIELVKFLLTKGADPNRQSMEPNYLTPLQAAVIRGSLPIVKILLQENVKMEVPRPVLVLFGTDTFYTDWIVNPKDMPRHRSALCDAVCRSHVHIALLLLRSGFDLTEEDEAVVQWMIKHTKSHQVRTLMSHLVTMPRRLNILCRDQIRRHNRYSIQKFVAAQEIPVTLKDMLLLKDIIA